MQASRGRQLCSETMTVKVSDVQESQRPPKILCDQEERARTPTHSKEKRAGREHAIEDEKLKACERERDSQNVRVKAWRRKIMPRLENAIVAIAIVIVIVIVIAILIGVG